jgi:hypothetical protein
VVMAQSFQSVKNDIDPLAVHEICRFRGMCLSELQRVISNATANNTTLALAAVLCEFHIPLRIQYSGAILTMSQA